VLRATKKAIRLDMSQASDEFILKNWRRVAKTEAFLRRPILKDYHYVGRFYYDCRFFDRDTRRCRVQETKPPICLSFPDNLRRVDRPLLLRSFPRCGYNGTQAGDVLRGGIV
jgi:Fe-S-cluster containining protein